MTIIRFEYKENYHMPATGGLVFMPHRKHATNETEVLPKPFHRTLVDGVAEVDLEPTGDDWVWSVTLGNDTQFYAIPDHEGTINHTDLIPIAPSTLDHRVEPAWWAELRQYQQLMVDYVDETRSNVDKAISTVDSIHNTLKTAVTDAARHESVAGAYSRQAQASADSAWEASKGPDGAAERAKSEADRAEIYRNEANTSHQQAAESATQAANSATDAATARDTTLSYRNEAQTARDEAQAAQDSAEQSRDGMIIDATVEGDNLLFDTVNGDTINAGNVRGPKGDKGDKGDNAPDDWVELDLINGWTTNTALYYRETGLGIQITGSISGTNATDETFANLPENTPPRKGPVQHLGYSGTTIYNFTVHSISGRMYVDGETYPPFMNINIIIPN